MVEKTNKLNICLVKPDYTAFDQIVKAGTPSMGIEGVGTFYVEESHVRRPSWVGDFFGNAFEGKFKLLNANSKGILLTRIDVGGGQRIFAVVFGHGRYLLEDGVIEDRFGLKVVLNTVVPTSLRSIDKLTLGSVPKQSREQISRAGAAANFGIDIEEDLLRAVTGSSKDLRLGKTISGKDALSVSVQVNAPAIHDFLQVCFDRYKAEDYKANFDWIDQIKDLRDRKTISGLDTILIKRLKDRVLDKIWMAPAGHPRLGGREGFSLCEAKTSKYAGRSGRKRVSDGIG